MNADFLGNYLSHSLQFKTFFTFATSIAAMKKLGYFALGCLSTLIFIVTSQLFTLLILFPFYSKKPRRNTFYTRLLSRYARFVNRTQFAMRFHYLDFPEDAFQKPSLIICNHQLFLDIPITIGLTPDLCVVNNNWHDNAVSKIFLDKYIRFVPTQAGRNSLPDLLRPYIMAGSSILIFPEGDLCINKIGRFRKGAFYLAQELNLPVQPILILYSQSLLEKRWFFFKRGDIYIKYLEPVFPDSELYNADYQITTKNINLLMKEAFEELKRESFN